MFGVIGGFWDIPHPEWEDNLLGLWGSPDLNKP